MLTETLWSLNQHNMVIRALFQKDIPREVVISFYSINIHI